MDCFVMKKNKFYSLIILLAALAISGLPVLAQSESPLTLSLSKDFGYSGFAGDIQGVFSMKVKGPEDLTRVVFFIDGQSIGEVTSPPFRLQFDTGSYSLGKHTLGAIGYTSAGQELQSNELVREFVPASTGASTVSKILLPILAVVAVAALVSYLMPALFTRGKTRNLAPGAPRNYAPLGGTICPKCGRPFAIHIWGLNVVVGKYDRCPYCGKWSIVRHASPDQLRAAEAAEIEQAGTTEQVLPETSPEEKLRKDLDNSRYQNL
jgi:hypothetical protein